MVEGVTICTQTPRQLGEDHWPVIPTGAIRATAKEKTEQLIARSDGMIWGTLRRLSAPLFPPTPGEVSEVAAKEAADLDYGAIGRELCKQFPEQLELQKLKELRDDLVGREMEEQDAAKDLLKEIERKVKPAALNGVLSYLAGSVRKKKDGVVANKLEAALKIRDRQQVAYNNHDILIVISEQCQVSPRQGFWRAWVASYEAESPQDKNMQAALRQFHWGREIGRYKEHYFAQKSRSIWWVFICFANFGVWRKTSTLIFAASSAASFMEAENAYTKNKRTHAWFQEGVGKSVLAASDKVAAAARETRRTINASPSLLSGFAVLMVGQGLVTELSVMPGLYLAGFGLMVVTSMSSGHYLGAGDLSPSSEGKAQGSAKAQDEKVLE